MEQYQTAGLDVLLLFKIHQRALAQVFYLALVKLPATPWLAKMMDIIAQGYPFQAQ